MNQQAEAHKEIMALYGNQQKDFRSGYDRRRSFIRSLPKPDWYEEAPTDPDEVRSFGGKEWRWCQTCNKWSTRHSTATHAEYISKTPGKTPHGTNRTSRQSKYKNKTWQRTKQTTKTATTKTKNPTAADLAKTMNHNQKLIYAKFCQLTDTSKG